MGGAARIGMPRVCRCPSSVLGDVGYNTGMLKLLLRVLAALYESNLAWIVGCLLVFLGGALFVAYRTTGETNIKELFMGMIFGDPAVRAKQKEFWDRNPNLEFVRNYSQRNLTEVRVRDASSRIALLDRSILSDVRVQTSPCEGARTFAPAEIFSGATNMVCFTLEKPHDPDGEYMYRFAASFVAPGKPIPVGNFYDRFLRSRGMQVSVLRDDIDGQTLEGERPGVGAMLRVVTRSWAGTTYVFLAAPDAFVAQRSEEPAPPPGTGPPLTTFQQSVWSTLQSISQALPKALDRDLEDRLKAFDEEMRLLPESQWARASGLLQQAAELSLQPSRRDRLREAAKAIAQRATVEKPGPNAETLATLKTISQVLPKVADKNLDYQLAAFDEALRLLPEDQREPASALLRQAAENCVQQPRRERLLAAARAVAQGEALVPAGKN